MLGHNLCSRQNSEYLGRVCVELCVCVFVDMDLDVNIPN